ncbi:questin oxidase family protein [Dactylosporangium darangshiense]|uniref:Questin oxidase family protein n=1 Tax=Dactylosporangium darangshiense TaxID=579108 RepID=A0ABP8DVN2_9ACTN
MHRYGPEYGGDEEGNHGMTNHAPMAAEVIVRRGLDINIDHWLDRYERRLDERPPAGDPIADWREALGDHRRLPAWTGLFASELRDRRWTDVLTQWWPRLLPGMVAGSTHGVIRVGHAVRTLRTGDSEPALNELANGLAFWAARYRPLPVSRHEVATDPRTALDHVPRLADQSGLIAHRIGRLGELPPRPAGDDPMRQLTSLVDAATRAYLSYGPAAPVLLVHTATAPNAVAHILPVLPRDLWAASYATSWSAVAAIVAMYAPAEGVDVAGGDPGTASAVLDRAAGHGDEHVLKFTDTAVEAYERRPDPDLLRAAQLAGALISTPH